MTDRVHIAFPEGGRCFCSAPLTPAALTLGDLEHAQPGAVCSGCLGQVMEYGRDSGPDRFTAYAWAERHPRVLSESFPVLAGVWAYRPSAAQVLDEQGDRLRDFRYTTD